MKRILAAVLFGTALSITACGGSGEPAPEKTVYVERDEETTNPSPSKDEQFIDAVARSMTPDLKDVPQQDVLDLGYTICESTSDGNDPADITATALGSGVNASDLGTIIGSAVTFLCPEHEDEWSAFFDSLDTSA